MNRGQDDHAYTLVDVDETNPEKIQAIADKLSQNEGIIRVRTIKNQEVGY